LVAYIVILMMHGLPDIMLTDISTTIKRRTYWH